MKKFETIKAITDEQKFSELIFDIIAEYDSPDAFAEFLSEDDRGGSQNGHTFRNAGNGHY